MKPIETQCITRENYLVKQAVCVVAVMVLYVLSGAVAAFGLIPLLLTGMRTMWRMCLSGVLVATSAVLWTLGRWAERKAL